MTTKDITQYALDKAKAAFDGAEVYRERATSIHMTYSNGKQEEYQLTESSGLSLRVHEGQRWASSYIEKLTEDSVDELISSLTQILPLSPDNPYMALHPPVEGVDSPAAPDTPDVDMTQLQALARDLDAATRAQDPCVKHVEATVTFRQSARQIANTLGLDLNDEDILSYALVQVILERDGEMKSGFAFRRVEDFGDATIVDSLAQEAYAEAAATYGAKPMPSGHYPVVIQHRTLSRLLGALMSMFSAESIMNGMSPLKDRLGDTIASPLVTLIDDPMHPEGFKQATFDDEGVPTAALTLIDQGVVRSYLHNTETAAFMGTTSTGNANRGYKSTSHPGTSTLALVPGDHTLEDLFEAAGDGLFITDLQGIHSGLNSVSGDFSLPANGFLIKDGKKNRPVNQITVAGNLFSLLEFVSAIGNDCTLSMSGAFFPSALISSMAIGGEAEA